MTLACNLKKKKLAFLKLSSSVQVFEIDVDLLWKKYDWSQSGYLCKNKTSEWIFCWSCDLQAVCF